uniref:Uncharacterized protein n=1 Tax=Arundo donax TaxID=35708 RepID=A0A0A9DI52_ARUDO
MSLELILFPLKYICDQSGFSQSTHTRYCYHCATLLIRMQPLGQLAPVVFNTHNISLNNSQETVLWTLSLDISKWIWNELGQLQPSISPLHNIFNSPLYLDNLVSDFTENCDIMRFGEEPLHGIFFLQF